MDDNTGFSRKSQCLSCAHVHISRYCGETVVVALIAVLVPAPVPTLMEVTTLTIV
jgi:hypothetical protein